MKILPVSNYQSRAQSQNQNNKDVNFGSVRTDQYGFEVLINAGFGTILHRIAGDVFGTVPESSAFRALALKGYKSVDQSALGQKLRLSHAQCTIPARIEEALSNAANEASKSFRHLLQNDSIPISADEMRAVLKEVEGLDREDAIRILNEKFSSKNPEILKIISELNSQHKNIEA